MRGSMKVGKRDIQKVKTPNLRKAVMKSEVTKTEVVIVCWSRDDKRKGCEGFESKGTSYI